MAQEIERSRRNEKENDARARDAMGDGENIYESRGRDDMGEVSGKPGEIRPAESVCAKSLSSLTLAYVGDSVYELILRTEAALMRLGGPNEINGYVKQYSNAPAQAAVALKLCGEMSDEEERVYKRGRNAKSVSAPGNCTIGQYRMATGLEALCAYLYFDGKWERAVELVRTGIAKAEAEKEGLI